MDGAPFLSFFRRAATAARRHSSKRSDGLRAKEEEPIPPCFFLIFPFRFSLFKKNGETQQRKTLAHLSFLSCDTKRTHQQPLNQGAQNVRCARCGHITSAVGGVGPSLPSGGPGAPDQQRDMAQLVCSSPQCRVVLMYPRGAERVQCSICGTTNCAIAVSPERTSPPPFSKGKKKKSKNPLSSGSPTHFFSFRSLSPLPLSLFPPLPGQPGRPPCLRRVPYHAHVRARGAEREMRRLQLRDPDLEAPSSASRLYPAAAAVFGPSVRGAAAAAAGAVFAAAGADRGG